MNILSKYFVHSEVKVIISRCKQNFWDQHILLKYIHPTHIWKFISNISIIPDHVNRQLSRSQIYRLCQYHEFHHLFFLGFVCRLNFSFQVIIKLKKLVPLLCSRHYAKCVTYLTLHYRLTKLILLTYVLNKSPGDQQFSDFPKPLINMTDVAGIQSRYT